LSIKFITLCDSAFLSRENKLNLIGIFDQILTENIPSQYLKMSLVIIFFGEPNSSHSVILTITSPDTKNLLSTQINITLGSNGQGNFISDLGNFPLPLAGDYQITLSEDSEILSTSVFKVSLITKPTGSKVIN
jgi:hypothetical protein